MCDDLFLREESSDLSISCACCSCRTRLYTLKQYATHRHMSDLPDPDQESLYNLVLCVHGSENMFCLSSERKDVFVSP